MTSISTVLNLNNAAVVHSTIQLPVKVHLPKCFRGTWVNSSSKHMSLNYQFHHKQISKVTECRVASQDVQQVRDKVDSTAQALDELENKKIEDSIAYIKTLLRSMDDGRISVSPYDTAWIALIKDLEGRDIPQFPSSLEWIAKHQLPDGSWGDEQFFCVYDRLVNTLACVVALRSWNVHAGKSEKGISYIKENVYKLEDANAEHMTCGFEVVFPALLQKARNLGIDDIPYEASVIKEIYYTREQKLKKIPMELMHKVPTSLLFSLEGLENLDWEKLLKLRSPDGSFLTSPSSTAFAFMETKDENCFKFIKNTVEKFNGGAPHTYPVDVFARLWAVDRLQRLGISRFFESEIKDCLDHINSVWTEKGVFSGRDSEFCDIDDTSMSIRLLRLHGYHVDPNALRNFKQDNKFSCYGGQMIESPSPMYNLYRASQLQFPGEEILEEARNFSYKFLKDTLASNQILDKWVISKHLPDEIRIGLEMPWYASLPRVEARYYLQHYAGADDVWIGKTLYRMPEISNDTYLELARMDFNRCQAQHQFEWIYMQEWYESSNVQEFGISRKELLLAYFLAAASIFEPERTKERIMWAKSQIVSRMITSFFNKETTIALEKKSALLTEFNNNINGLYKINSATRECGLVDILLATLHQLLEGFDKVASNQLKNAWGAWLMKLEQGEANGGADAELLVTTLNICAGHIAFNEGILSHNDYKTLSKLSNKICQHLSQIQNKKVLEINDLNTTNSSINDKEIEQDMQALTKSVLEESVGIDRNIKQAFLSVVKTFYYGACNVAETIDVHIFKVLFEPVV
uniref:(+)-CPP synthase n=1 Tax=Callicarpa americana TaxID=204211 RepID=A0A977Q8S2_CALAM|nr:(+)-CPP synthase [Callicarpa americana]